MKTFILRGGFSDKLMVYNGDMSRRAHTYDMDEDRHIALLAARISLFVIFVWFGVLKVVDASPANPLIEVLLDRTLPFIAFRNFIMLFGLFEVLIGALFLLPRFDRITIPLFFLHVFATALPLILLPAIAWQRFLIPTLEGQYIIKNIVLVSLVLSIMASHRRVPG